MQLKLKGRGVRLREEFTITNFEILIGISASRALKNNVQLDKTSIRNMAALGIEPDGPPIADLLKMEMIT
ncbi:MAG: hypothetical protein V7750_03180 [Sneathiella sp.]